VCNNVLFYLLRWRPTSQSKNITFPETNVDKFSETYGDSGDVLFGLQVSNIMERITLFFNLSKNNNGINVVWSAKADVTVFVLNSVPRYRSK